MNSDLLGEDVEDYNSDVHKEYMELKFERNSFQSRKRFPAHTKDIPCGVAGSDLKFDETQVGKKSIEGRLGDDEPYYSSFDAHSVETGEDEYWLEDEKKKNEKLSRKRSSSIKSYFLSHL